MQVSTTEKAIYIKLVYYGPGLSGKTTNLQTIHRLADASCRRPMVSLRTEGDRTLFFDLLPLELGQLFGVDLRVKLYTVPGQIQYDTTRRQVLAGADGVVFVADSSPNQREANVVMLRHLKTHLQANGFDPDAIPLVFQWNKRDLAELMSPEEMDRELNWRDCPAFCAVATDGAGVIETFQEITARTLESLAEKASALAGQPDAGEIRSKVQAAFGHLTGALNKAADRGGFAVRGSAADRTGPLTGEFTAERLSSAFGPAEKRAPDSSKEPLLTRLRRERRAVLTVCRRVEAASDPEALLRVALRAVLAVLGTPVGSVLLAVKPRAPLKEVAVVGRAGDPLNAVQAAGVGSVAASLLAKGAPLHCCNLVGELLFGQPHPAVAGLRAVLSAPIHLDQSGGALLLLYTDAGGRDFDDHDLEFVATMAAVTTAALRGLLAPAGDRNR